MREQATTGALNNHSLNEFRGPKGRKRLINALTTQTLVHDEELANELATCVRVEEIRIGTTIITQGASDHDLVFILAGEVFVSVGRKVVVRRGPGQHVGEMAVVDREARRSATVRAGCDSIIARIGEPEFTAIANRFPSVWRRIALELAQRLTARGESGRR
ncbi:MAG: cyclic nucleotide-binding domain-containing protein [Candidatus Binataceae bacterium]